MITLKEALGLTKTADDDICYLRPYGKEKHEAIIMSAKEVRDKYNLCAVKVFTIMPRFSCGDWVGMEFEVSGVEKKRMKIERQKDVFIGKYSVQDIANFILWYILISRPNYTYVQESKHKLKRSAICFCKEVKVV